MPALRCENDVGGRFTKRPLRNSQGRFHLSSVFCSVSASLAGPAQSPSDREALRADALAGAARDAARRDRRNHHPTVKPFELTRWLVRLVTPPGGTVLDPFAGSGTTDVTGGFCTR